MHTLVNIIIMDPKYQRQERILNRIDNVLSKRRNAWYNMCLLSLNDPSRFEHTDLEVIRSLQIKSTVHGLLKGANISIFIVLLYRAKSMEPAAVITALSTYFVLIPCLAYLKERKIEYSQLQEILTFKYAELLYYDIPKA